MAPAYQRYLHWQRQTHPQMSQPIFAPFAALLRTQLIRQELVERWERQIAAQGGPTAAELGEKPELVCRQFVPQIQACLDWHSSTWLALEAEFHDWVLVGLLIFSRYLRKRVQR